MAFGLDPERLDTIECDDPLLLADMIEAVNIRRAEEDKRWAMLAKSVMGARM